MKKDNQKNLMMYGVLGVVFLVVVYLLLNNFVFTGETEIEDLIGGGSKKKIEKIKVNMEKINTEVLDDYRFRELEYLDVEKPELKNLDVGKSNPFESPSAGSIEE